MLFRSQGPAEIESSLKSSYESQIADLKSKLTETEMSLEKSKSEQKNKTKRLVTNVDGSSELVESESSVTLETEFLAAKSKAIEYENTIQRLKSQIEQTQVVKASLLNVFSGLGAETSGKFKGIAGGNYGMNGIALTSDGIIDHAAYYTLNFKF